MQSFTAENYIRLEDFEGGRIWVANVERSKRQLLKNLRDISEEKLKEIFKIILAEERNWKIYEDTAWVISIKPLPYFEILIVFNEEDEEEGFPAELRIFYSKTSLAVPTEDAYVFTHIYLDFMSSFCKGNIIIMETPDLMSLEKFAEAHDDLDPEKVSWDVIGQRFAPIEVIDQETIKSISRTIDGEYMGRWDRESNVDWVIKIKIFIDLDIYYVKFVENEKKKLRIYYTMSVIHYEARPITYFGWLFLNTIIREARKILGDKLPRLSKYL